MQSINEIFSLLNDDVWCIVIFCGKIVMYNELIFLFDVIPLIEHETITFCSLIFKSWPWRARESLPVSFNISDTNAI